MASQETYELNNPQRLFIRYTIAVLVDLTVLNLFDEYWALVTIGSFTISLAAAFLLQVLLRLAISLEHRIAAHFKGKEGVAPKIYRGVSTYGILVGSKFVMLETVDLAFGDRVEFSVPYHGVVAFFAVIITIILVEVIIGKIYIALDDEGDVLPDPA